MTSQPPSPADDYFLEIESAFARFRGTPFVFSAKDWALMKGWHEEGIPLSIVLEAIESCFLKSAEGKRRRVVSSLAYCRHAVKEIWADRRDMYVGAGAETPETGMRETLERIVTDLRALADSESSAVSRLFRNAAAEVEAIGPSSVPAAEERLAGIEETLFREVLGVLSEGERSELDAEVDRRLGGSRMSQEIAERTRDANLRGILRSRYRLPRLSLFA